jgi:hypothetical protein
MDMYPHSHHLHNNNNNNNNNNNKSSMYKYEREIIKEAKHLARHGDPEQLAAFLKKLDRKQKRQTTSKPMKKFLLGFLAVASGAAVGALGTYLATGGTMAGLSATTVAAAKAFGGKAAVYGGTLKTALVSVGSKAWSRIKSLGGLFSRKPKIQPTSSKIPRPFIHGNYRNMFYSPANPIMASVPQWQLSR